MVYGKKWRFFYGAIYICAAAALLIALGLHAPSVATKALSAFGFDWALWPRTGRLTLGVLPFVALWVLLTLFERKFPAGPVKPASNWFLNLKVNVFAFVLAPFLNVLLGIFLGTVSHTVSLGLLDLRSPQGVGVAETVALFLISFFIRDFFYYWYHRFEHESILWQQHKVHHMDEHVSAITAHRVHWLENLFYQPMVALPTALLVKFDPAAGGIVLGAISLFTAFWQTFFHANLKIGFGWASPLFVSPQFHRIHHSRLPQHHDKNFAGFFPILDVIFGTYYHPKRGEYPPTGVHDEKDVTSFRESLFLPLREWWKMLRDWRRRHSLAA